MCQAGQPRQYHNTINKLILRDIFYDSQADCALNLTLHIVKFFVAFDHNNQNKSGYFIRVPGKMSIFLIYGYEMSIAMSP
nr:Uncharacterised protein [Salmonella sp. NCTC 7297]